LPIATLRLRIAAPLLLAGSTLSPDLLAAEWNASALTGVCGTGVEREYWQHTCWFNGVRADVLFGRSRNLDFGAGPFADVTTAGFDDIRLGGGASALLPIHPFLPLVFSGGGYARKSEIGWEPGLEGYVFFGTRSYNFHSSYGLAAGLIGGLHFGLGESRESAIVIALQLDGQILLLPFVAAYELVSGPAYE
jgi:hypothetical protein